MKGREELKARIQQKLAAKLAEKNQQKKYTPPLYDNVFFEGLKWLDSLAEEPFNLALDKRNK